MRACIRASLVLVSLFLFFHVIEAGLLRDKFLGRPMFSDVDSEKSPVVHWPNVIQDRSLVRGQNDVQQKKEMIGDGYKARWLSQRQIQQCRYGSCGGK